MKKIRVRMPDNSRWDVPASIIANDRASYFASKDSNPGSRIYVYEYELAMKEDSKLINWASGNMDWEDVFRHAKRVPGNEATDYKEGWMNGEKCVIEE